MTIGVRLAVELHQPLQDHGTRAANGTIRLIGLDGQACAIALPPIRPEAAVKASMQAWTRVANLRVLLCMFISLGRCCWQVNCPAIFCLGFSELKLGNFYKSVIPAQPGRSKTLSQNRG